jgi:ribosome modulation factor
MAREFSSNWDLDTLNKAYQQGYMAGLMGLADDRCPYHGEIITAAWEGGWEDGRSAHGQNQKVTRAKIA